MSVPGAAGPSSMADLAAEALARCDVLATLSEEPHRLTRTYLSKPMAAATGRVARWMEAAGLTAHVDAAGNVVGRREARGPAGTGGTVGASGVGRADESDAGRARDARTFLVGSHLETVPGAGRYDGILGVVLGVAAAAALPRDLPLAIEVIGFAEEEGVRFGTPFLGSRAVVGDFGPDLLALRDAAGLTVADALRRSGLDPDRVGAAARPPAPLAGYLEIHIEQGPRLEQRDLPLGIVSAIVGQTRCSVTFTGRSGHAGTTPMAHRRDALAGAAAFLVEVERLAKRTTDLVVTAGQIAIEPGAANVIPGEARLSLDVRHVDDRVRTRAVAALVSRARRIAATRALAVDVAVSHEQRTVPCDPDLSARLAAAVERCGWPAYLLHSGAGHDAMIVARITPVAMLFVRSPDGISHHPDETVLLDDVEAALRVAVDFLTAEASRGAL